MYPDNRLDQRLTQQLYTQARAAIAAMPITAALLVYGLKDHLNHTLLLSWLGLVFLITLYRSILVYRYTIASPESQSQSVWANRYVFTEILSGLIWGGTGYFLPQLDILHQMLIFFAMGGMLMGASVILAPRPRTFYAFETPALGVFCIWLFSLENNVYQPIIFLTVVFGVVLSYTVRLMNGQIRQTLLLDQQNTDLLKHLKHTNETLQKKIGDEESARNALVQSQNEMTRIFNQLQDTYYQTDRNGKIIRVSPSVTDLLGYQPDELIGTFMADLYADPSQRTHFLSALQSNNGQVKAYEAPLMHKDNSTVWVSTNAHFTCDEAGNISGVEGTTRDITKNRIAAETLLKTKEEYKALFELNRGILENSPVGIMTLDQDKNITYVNPALSNIAGVPQGEKHAGMGRMLTELPSIKASGYGNLVDTVASGQSIDVEVPLTTIYGKEINIEVKAFPLTLNNGKYGSVFFISDISNRIAQTQALRSEITHAKQISEIRNELLVHLSQNLRAPLTDIMGITEVLLKQDENQSLHRDLGLIKNSTRHLLDYVRHFIETSESEDKLPANISLKDFFDRMEYEYNQKAFRRKIAFAFENAVPAASGLKIDFRLLKNILDNLVENTFANHQHPISELKVKVELVNESSLHVTVTDNGPSVSPHDALVMDFKQAMQPNTSAHQHLYLIIANQLVVSLKGKIWLEHKHLRCVDVHLELPLWKDRVDEKKDAVAPKRSLRILVVDDNENNQRVIQRMLAHLGHRPLQANNGEQALERVLAETFDVILMDINMPVLNGLETTEAIRQLEDPDKANIPIIAMTANVMEKERYAWKEAGMNAFLEKPLGLDVVSKTLQQTCPVD